MFAFHVIQCLSQLIALISILYSVSALCLLFFFFFLERVSGVIVAFYICTTLFDSEMSPLAFVMSVTMALCKRSLNYCCNMVTDGCLFIFVDFDPRFLLGRCVGLGKGTYPKGLFFFLCCKIQDMWCRKYYMPRKLAGVRTRIV